MGYCTAAIRQTRSQHSGGSADGPRVNYHKHMTGRAWTIGFVGWKQKRLNTSSVTVRHYGHKKANLWVGRHREPLLQE